jgi:hypothetical protein
MIEGVAEIEEAEAERDSVMPTVSSCWPIKIESSSLVTGNW